MGKKQKGADGMSPPLPKKAGTTKNKSSTKCRQLKVYAFGNEDLECDRQAITAIKNLREKYSNINFVALKPNADLPFADGEDVVIMDVVAGLTQPELIRDPQVQKILTPPRSTVHDFDLGFQLAYLKKLGRLGKVTIIGLPMSGRLNYARIHSIFKKLVAQDMQGS